MKEVVTPLHGGSVRSGHEARAAPNTRKIPHRGGRHPRVAPPGPRQTQPEYSQHDIGAARSSRACRAACWSAHRRPIGIALYVYLGILPIAAGRRRAAWPSATRVGTELRQGRVVGGRRGSASAVGATTEAL